MRSSVYIYSVSSYHVPVVITNATSHWLAMDMPLKKDVGQSAKHATLNTPWVSG
jgi:hypothetical protein